MKFIINTTNLQRGGALQVTLSLLEEWESFTQHNFHVFLSPQLTANIDKSKFRKHFHFYEFEKNPLKSLATLFWFKKKINQLEKKIKPDAIFTVFGPAIWTPQRPHLVGFANGFYLFNESKYIQERVTSSTPKKMKYYLRRCILLKQLKKEAKYFWVESELAKAKLVNDLNLKKEQITVISNAYSSNFNAPILSNGDKNKTFNLLYVSSYYQHKNFEIIPKVIEILIKKNIQCTFTLTLEEHEFNRIFSNFKDSKYLNNIGQVSSNELPKLYYEANAIFMPSLLETFSANYPEAMQMNKPILTSDLDFAHQICGNAALYFDPYKPMDIATKIIKLLENEQLQSSLINEGENRIKEFETAESRAEKLIKILEKMGEN